MYLENTIPERYIATDETFTDANGNERLVHYTADKKSVGYFQAGMNKFVRISFVRWRSRSKGERCQGHQVYYQDGQRGCYEGDMFYPLEVFKIRIAGQFHRPTLTRTGSQPKTH